MSVAKRTQPPILCWVTDRHAIPAATDEHRRAALIARIREAAGLGLEWIQLREKDLESGSLAQLTTDAVNAVHSGTRNSADTRIIVNDRLDVAWATNSGGVHLGESSLPVRDVARFRRHDFLTGISCHSVESVRQAESDGANYAFFGPIFATPSKAAFGPPQGEAALAAACRAVSIPVVAIGGITATNVGLCMKAGAAGIAAIRMFQEAPDLPSLIGTLRQTQLR